MPVTPKADTDKYREDLSQKFYGITAGEFRTRYLAGRYDDTKSKKTLITLLRWFPGLSTEKKNLDSK